MKLTDNEIRDITRFIEVGKPLPQDNPRIHPWVSGEEASIETVLTVSEFAW